jgi:hypothetical protein
MFLKLGKAKMEPISDKAEVSIDFPDKYYSGSFSRGAKFDARSEDDGLFIKLERHEGTEKRAVGIHLHHYLLADILSEWAASLKAQKTMEKDHKKDLLSALKKAEKALERL